MTMYIDDVIIVILIILLIWAWVKEPRIYLYIFNRMLYGSKKFPQFIDRSDYDHYFQQYYILENNWEVIQKELENLLQETEKIPRFHQIDNRQNKISKDEGPGWKTFIFKIYGKFLEANCKKCPETFKLLQQCDNMPIAMFSILEPNSKIPIHRGYQKGVLRYHLPLIVPKKNENCYIVVGGEKQSWEAGKSMLFDDTYLHYVENHTDDYRVVLFCDIKYRKEKFSTLDRISDFGDWLVIKSPMFQKKSKAAIIARNNNNDHNND